MPLRTLAAQEYVGRMLCVGRTADSVHNVIVYGVTGRSLSSRARRLEEANEGGIRTTVTDAAILKKGNPALLIYPCVQRMEEQWFVSNGGQTDLLVETAQKRKGQGLRDTPLELLVASFSMPFWVEGSRAGESLDLTSYEPDAPTYTPRISSIMGLDSAAIAICKREGECVARSYFERPLQAGRGHLIATYSGQNVPSGVTIPSFEGEPLSLDLPWETPEQTLDAFYESLGPVHEGEAVVSPGADFRVGVAVLFIHRSSHQVTSCIRNAVEQEQIR